MLSLYLHPTCGWMQSTVGDCMGGEKNRECCFTECIYRTVAVVIAFISKARSEDQHGRVRPTRPTRMEYPSKCADDPNDVKRTACNEYSALPSKDQPRVYWLNDKHANNNSETAFARLPIRLDAYECGTFECAVACEYASNLYGLQRAVIFAKE